MCLLYKSHLEEIKNLQQQDILHILFSKALHCSAIQVILINYSSLHVDSNGRDLYSVYWCPNTVVLWRGRGGVEGQGEGSRVVDRKIGGVGR